MSAPEHRLPQPQLHRTPQSNYRGRRLGCVLVHGLSSSPAALREWAEAFSRHGIDTHLVLLPGHGTRPEDLLQVQWEDWYAAVVQAVQDMRQHCDKVFVLGQSLGGSLALRVAAHNAVDGVITLAAIAYLKNWRLWFLPFLRPFLRWRQSPDNDIARPISDSGSYDRLPLHAIEQLLELAGLVRRDLPQIEVPVLLVQSENDHVAPPGNLDFIYEHIGAVDKQLMRLRDSYHVISLDHDRLRVIDHSIRFLHRVGYGDSAERLPRP
jgi:carboxylesterase